MPNTNETRNKTNDQTRLFYRFAYISSALTVVAGVLCIYPLYIYSVIPAALFSYAVLNMVNMAVFKKSGNLKYAAIRAAATALAVTLVIILFSGGINSPFIFILAVIVLGGYAGARIFGTVYLYAILAAILLIYAVGELDIPLLQNEVPLKSQPHFSLISVLLAVYLVGGVFGRNILRAHLALNTSKSEIELRISEKELLLREVHHRVKNNLQTVSSLLSLQGKNSSNEKIKALIKGSQNRVISMAIIHEMLYIRNDLSKIEFHSYVKELTDYLLNSNEEKNKRIRIQLNIPEVKLSIDTAILLGLLINETVTNSLKYGFSDDSGGRITIALTEEKAENSYILGINDNGVGFSPDLDFRNSKSLGLKLIHNLARQLRGSVERKPSEKGTNYQVAFKDVNRHLGAIT
ncbi:MAG: sensor histidine kinase [Pricia sp.]